MKRLLWTFAAFAVGLLCGCSKENPSVEDNGMITLAPVMDKDSGLTRASLYENENDLRADLFHTHAFFSGSTTTYFDSNLKYSTEDVDATKHQWLFYDNNSYRNFYWPLKDNLDFFAYAPASVDYVTVDYATNPPVFTVTMPLTNTGTDKWQQESMKEFMYAYTPDRGKAGGEVPLEFKHPFAAIIFKVKQSQRGLTVNNISINGIQASGKGSFTKENPDVVSWTSGSTGNMVLTIGKKIPDQVNFGGELCGPYLILPQKNDGAGKEFKIECHWKGYDADSDEISADTKTLTGTITNDWEASQVYVYTLDLGNSREEILFEVAVTDWKYVYEHTFEIE